MEKVQAEIITCYDCFRNFKVIVSYCNMGKTVEFYLASDYEAPKRILKQID
jgi:hypothetical protein